MGNQTAVRKRKGGFFYIMASGRNGTLYAGVTNDIVRRVAEHRSGEGSAFVSKYDVFRLVHVEWYDDITLAIEREKRVKRWKRVWKLRLISSGNPEWGDLYDEACRTWGDW
jgi:putative endonuclease